MDQKLLHSVIEEALADNEAYFVDLVIGEGNKIALYADADEGIKVNQLKQINRQVEAAFDRDVEDFELTVSSPGLERPLKVRRQHINNVGRWVNVKLSQEENVIGQLVSVLDDELVLSIPGAKRKDLATERRLTFDEIIETKIEIRF